MVYIYMARAGCPWLISASASIGLLMIFSPAQVIFGKVFQAN